MIGVDIDETSASGDMSRLMILYAEVLSQVLSAYVMDALIYSYVDLTRRLVRT